MKRYYITADDEVLDVLDGNTNPDDVIKALEGIGEKYPEVHKFTVERWELIDTMDVYRKGYCKCHPKKCRGKRERATQMSK